MSRIARQLVGGSVLAIFIVGNASAAILEAVDPPGPLAFVQGTDFNVLTYSGLGDVTARVFAVDIQFGLGNTSTSGCEAADFAGFPAGYIALLQRGTCNYESKAENAAAAGAVGALIFNQGDTVDRQGLFGGTLGPGYMGGIPVMSLPTGLGAEFYVYAERGGRLRMQVEEVDAMPAPEPSTIALLGLGLAGLAVSRRRKP